MQNAAAERQNSIFDNDVKSSNCFMVKAVNFIDLKIYCAAAERQNFISDKNAKFKIVLFLKGY